MLTIVNVYPTLLGTYGDRGNATILAARATMRGLPAQIVEVGPEQPVPDSGDLYVLGGAEDAAQVAATQRLSADGGLARAVARGASLLAVCAGYQVIGETFWASGREVAGLGLVDARSMPGAEERAVGELRSAAVAGEDLAGLPPLTGYENHAGITRLGASARPLGQVLAGVGNGDGTEGLVQGSVIGTYAHGPVLARNPALADALLARSLGPLPALDDELVEAFRAQRLGAPDLAPNRRAGRRRSERTLTRVLGRR